MPIYSRLLGSITLLQEEPIEYRPPHIGILDLPLSLGLGERSINKQEQDIRRRQVLYQGDRRLGNYTIYKDIEIGILGNRGPDTT